jgi:hypothetical protein
MEQGIRGMVAIWRDKDSKSFIKLHRILWSQFILLSIGLNSIPFSEKYKVIFYAEARDGTSLLTDFTKSIAIPSVQLAVSTSPTSVELRNGEETTVEVKVNSTLGYEPTIYFYTINETSDVDFDFKYDTLRIPSHGEAITPLTINSSDGALTGPRTFFILINSSFPADTLFDLPIISKPDLVAKSSFLITVLPPLTLQEHLNNFVKSWLTPITGIWTFLAGVATVITPVVIRIYSNRKKKGRIEKPDA